MVEISNARYEELIRAETTLVLICRAAKNLPSYKVADEVKILVGNDESEVNADAE